MIVYARQFRFLYWFRHVCHNRHNIRNTKATKEKIGHQRLQVSSFFTQLHKLPSQQRGSLFIWFHFRSSYMIYFIYICHIHLFHGNIYEVNTCMNVASSVQKVSYSKPLHNKSRCLNTMWSFLTFKVINTWIFLYFQKVLTMKLWRNTQFTTAILFAVRGESVSKEIGGWVRLPVWRHVWRQWFSKWRAKCSSKRLIKFSKLLRKYCSDYLDLEIYGSYFHRNVQWCNEF